MKSVYIDSSVPEKTAKSKFGFPEFIMMENAAAALEKEVRSVFGTLNLSEDSKSVLILSGTGNNGGDGYALARRLCGSLPVTVYSAGEPKTREAAMQKSMADSCGVKITDSVDEALFELKKINGVIIDCLYGTGFHGTLNETAEKIIEAANDCNAYRIACDIPSGIDRNGIVACVGNGKKLAFCAGTTVTMGALKTALFSDVAKDFCGKIVVAELGLSSEKFCSCADPDAFLLEKDDIKLPFRTKKSAHKGDFGHAVFVMGEKAGAAVIAGTAALSFGAGLVTELDSGLCGTNFMMNPELMISDFMPERASAVLLGSGLGRSEKSFAVAERVFEKVCKMKNISLVLDADFFYYEKIKDVLERLNSIPGSRVILTPHPKELHELLRRSSVIDPVDSKSAKHITGRPRDSEITVSDVCTHRFEYARQFAQKFPNLVLVSKGADSYICAGKNCFICDRGTSALAKAGSGDVLAGLCTALLAQGYSALEAAKTAVFAHAEAVHGLERNYECTPLKLVGRLGQM